MAGSHIAIPTILKIGSGTLGNVGKYLQSSGFKKAVVFFGNGLVEMFGKTVMDSLSEADIEVLSYCEARHNGYQGYHRSGIYNRREDTGDLRHRRRQGH